MAQSDIKSENLEDRFKSIELRLENLESALALNFRGQVPIEPGTPVQIEGSYMTDETNEEERGFEFSFGRTGLAWLGNFVLLFAVIFSTEYFITLGFKVLSVVAGFMSVAVIFLISRYLRKANPSLSFMLKTTSQIILFYEVMRMHFFSADPLIPGMFPVIAGMLLVIAYQVYSTIQNKSQTFGFLSVLFILLTAIASDTTHIMLLFTTAAAIVATLWFKRYNWQSLLIITIILSYVTFLLWLYGNPVMGHPLVILSEHKFGHLYLFALGGCYSLLPLMRKEDRSTDDLLIGATILNGLFFTLILSLVSVKFFSGDYVILFSVITVCCLAYAVILKYVSDWQFASAFFALYGFLAMSISLYGIFGLPEVYLLLSVQSLIVVLMALWFRNRLMIVMNCFLFLGILLVYQFSSEPDNAVNFSFALVPLISARVINWQKARLDIKTDIIRNLYLITGFFMVLYALYHGVPKQFVTLSWTVAALLYFLLSIILTNVKYRYMALGTMICAAVYLFLVDLARIEIIYRVLALLFLAVVSIGISIYYSSRLKKPVKNQESSKN